MPQSWKPLVFTGVPIRAVGDETAGPFGVRSRSCDIRPFAPRSRAFRRSRDSTVRRSPAARRFAPVESAQRGSTLPDPPIHRPRYGCDGRRRQAGSRPARNSSTGAFETRWPRRLLRARILRRRPRDLKRGRRNSVSARSPRRRSAEAFGFARLREPARSSAPRRIGRPRSADRTLRPRSLRSRELLRAALELFAPVSFDGNIERMSRRRVRGAAVDPT
jgi:hypothetical protein